MPTFCSIPLFSRLSDLNNLMKPYINHFMMIYFLDACLHHLFWLSLHSFHILLISCMRHSKYHTFLQLRCCVWNFIPSFSDEDINIYSNKDLWNWMEFYIVALTLTRFRNNCACSHAQNRHHTESLSRKNAFRKTSVMMGRDGIQKWNWIGSLENQRWNIIFFLQICWTKNTDLAYWLFLGVGDKFRIQMR